MPEKDSIGEIELALKMISTYGVAIVFASVLLGYFLWKDYSQGQQHIDALKNNTKAMQSIEMTLQKQTQTISDLKGRIGR